MSRKIQVPFVDQTGATKQEAAGHAEGRLAVSGCPPTVEIVCSSPGLSHCGLGLNPRPPDPGRCDRAQRIRLGLAQPLPPASLHLRRIVHAITARGSGPVTTSISHPSSRCTSFNLAAMSISCEQVGRQSPQPTQDVPFRVKAAYSLRARSNS